MLRRIKLVNIRIEDVECVRVPERPHELARPLLHRIVGEAVRQPRRTILIEVPADCVRTVTAQGIHRLDGVALGLAHLLPVLVLHMTEDNDVSVRALVEEQRSNRNQRVEPAACLIDRLGDEVRREVFLEDFLVLKRIMPLCKRHCTGVKPAVDDLGYAVHRPAALFTRERDCIDVRTMQLNICGTLRLKLAQLSDRANRMLMPAVAFPDIERRAPIAVAADAPVLHMLDPVAKAPLSDGLWNPVDRRIVCNKRIAHRRHADEPRGARVVDQRRIAAPAMRIAVCKLGGFEELAALFEILENQRVGILYEDPRPIRLLRHLALVVDELDERHIVLAADAVIVLAECGRRVDDARAVLGRNVVVADNEERLVLHVFRCKGVERLVLAVLELAAFHCREDFAIAPRVREHAVHQRLGEVIDLAVHTHLHIGHIRIHAESEVRRQRPRGRRPREEVGILIGSLEAHDCRTLRHILIALRNLVRGERRAAARAVRDDLVPLIEEPLLPDLLERPPLGLDEVVLVRDVGMLHVRPEADDIGELLPHRLVCPDGFAALLDERLDAVVLDLLLAVDADRLLDLELDGQPMRVPARLAKHLAPLHRLIARQHILDHTRQDMPDVRAAVRRRRTIVERERLAALTLIHRLLCNMILTPKIRNGFLTRGKIQIGIYFLVQRNPSRSVVTSF